MPARLPEFEVRVPDFRFETQLQRRRERTAAERSRAANERANEWLREQMDERPEYEPLARFF